MRRRVAEGAPPWNQGRSRTLTAEAIRRLFSLLDAELAAAGAQGEVHLVGGAVMCLALGARESTGEEVSVDALFRPTGEVRAAAARVAALAQVPADWLNDAVKGFLGVRGVFDPFLELPNLRVYVARTDYLFAMKCMSMRLEAGVTDHDDVRYLLRALDIRRVADALAVVERYFEAAAVPLKTRLALEEILGATGATPPTDVA